MVSTRLEEGKNLLPTGRHNRNGKHVFKSSAVLVYNSSKKGVNYLDQMLVYYTEKFYMRKSTKWYKKVTFELLLGTSVVNAFVIFNELLDKKLK